jgi:DNA-directed RNA polymerase subunit RPC12/RpoP
MKTYIKFACIYCGQRMECHPRFTGRQILCPACLHRIVIPPGQSGNPPAKSALAQSTWDAHVPMPKLEIPTRYRRRMSPTPALA